MRYAATIGLAALATVGTQSGTAAAKGTTKDTASLVACVKLAAKSRAAAAVCVTKWVGTKWAEHEVMKFIECIYDGNSVHECAGIVKPEAK